MEPEKFFGRRENLRQLEAFHREKISGLVFVRGRRRIGKSTLIKHFFSQKEHVFFFAGHEEEGDRLTRRRFAKAWDSFTGDRRLGTIRAVDLDWTTIFREMRSHIKKSRAKVTFIFDEIQWLHTKGNGFVGHLKDFWESLHQSSLLKVVISGSSTRFFNDHIIGAHATLRGIATRAAISVLPFTLEEVQKYYFPDWSRQEVALVYMMTGGVPYYLERIPYRQEKNCIRAINDGIFCDSSIFLEEADNIIKVELLRQTAAERIKSLLRHLNFGGKSVSALSHVTGETQDYVLKTMTMLREVGLIRTRIRPAGDGKKKDETIYFLEDLYLNFYFSILEPNSFKIKKNIRGMIFSNLIQSQDGYYIPGFSGEAFELLIFNLLEYAQISLDFGRMAVLTKLRIQNVNYSVQSFVLPQKSQIDLLVVSDMDREVRVMEIKWVSSPRSIEARFVNDTLQKVIPQKYLGAYRRSNYLLLSTKVPDSYRRLAAEKNVEVISLDDLWPESMETS